MRLAERRIGNELAARHAQGDELSCLKFDGSEFRKTAGYRVRLGDPETLHPSEPSNSSTGGEPLSRTARNSRPARRMSGEIEPQVSMTANMRSGLCRLLKTYSAALLRR
jgi:hypothetical protein